MKLSTTIAALAVFAALGGAASLSAQNYMKFLEPVQAWPDFEFKVSGAHEFDRDIEDRNEDFNTTSLGLDLGTTVYADNDFGIGLDLGAKYRDVEDRSALPDQFAMGNFGLRTTFKLNDQGLRFFGTLSATSFTDNEDVESEDISVDTLMAVSVPLGREWTLIPGLYFSSRSLDGNTPAIPYPLLEAMYRPDDSFTLIFGIPATGFFWSPNDWLSVNAFGFLLSSWNLAVHEKASDTVKFDQFYRYTGDSYRLTDEAFFPDDYTVTSQRQELGLGMTYAPTWERENGKKTTMTIRFEYAAQFGYKWEFRNDDRNRLGNPLRLEPGNVVRVEFGFAF